jgi:chemotaxis protein CheX
MTLTTPQLIEEVGDLLKSSVSEVFTTVFNINAHPVPFCEIRKSDEMLIAGSVGFVGDVNGVVYIYLKASFARKLASQMLGMPEAELDGDELIGDVIGELSNMIVGSTKSRLCDSGASCKLTVPSIVRGQNLSAQPVRLSEGLSMSIACNDDLLLLELIIKPSN